MFAFAAAGLTVAFSCGLVCLLTRGFPRRFPPQALEFANAASDRFFFKAITTNDIRTGNLLPIGVAGRSSPPAVLVWGDSHASAALPAIDVFLKEKGLSGCAATHGATPPVLDWYIPKRGLRENAISFNDAVFRFIESRRVPIVLLCAYWSTYAGIDGQGSESFNDALLSTVHRLVAAGARPYILMDVPSHSFNIPAALSRSFISQSDISCYCAKPTIETQFDMIAPDTLMEIEEAGARIIDPKPRFLDPTGQQFIIQSDGIALYRDRDHLSTKGAKVMLLPLLRERLLIEE